METDKEIRIMYQDIVYKICNIYDKIDGTKPGHGVTIDAIAEKLDMLIHGLAHNVEHLQQRVDELESICKHCHGTGSYTVATGDSYLTDCRYCKQPDPSAGAGEDDMWVGAIKESRTEESEVCITCEGDKVIPISNGIEIIRYENCPTCSGSGKVE